MLVVDYCITFGRGTSMQELGEFVFYRSILSSLAYSMFA